MKTDGPIVVLAVHRVGDRLSLCMALEAGVICLHEIQPRRVDDVQARRTGDMFTPGPMAALAPHVPFGRLLRLNVVVDRMASIAEGTRGPGSVIALLRWIMAHPPIGVRRNEVWAPLLVQNVPLRRRHVVVVPFANEIPLLPL